MYDDYMVLSERNTKTSKTEIRPNFEIHPNGYGPPGFEDVVTEW